VNRGLTISVHLWYMLRRNSTAHLEHGAVGFVAQLPCRSNTLALSSALPPERW
jgi:hypothetical protein